MPLKKWMYQQSQSKQAMSKVFFIPEKAFFVLVQASSRCGPYSRCMFDPQDLDQRCVSSSLKGILTHLKTSHNNNLSEVCPQFLNCSSFQMQSRVTITPNNARSYISKISRICPPKNQLNKDRNNRHTRVDGKKPTRPQLQSDRQLGNVYSRENSVSHG